MDDLFERSLAQAPLVVLDTETTGLSPALGHRVVEVAAVRLEGWQQVDSFSSLINPGRPMEAGASRVNGIYDEDLVDAPPFAEIAGQLQQVLQGAVLVAHNAHFDAAFLGMETDLLRFHPASSQTIQTLTNPWLCTLQMARRLFYFERNSLGQVARSLGVRTGRAHRALNDVHTTIAIFKRMVHQLEKMRLISVGDYLHAQGGAIYVPQHEQPALPPVLIEALARRCSLRIRYEVKGSETDRVISPLYATEQNGAAYVIAFCHLRQAQRTFRLDRILQATIVE
jgi:DNA polymerase-3 subunit epsilon